MNPVSGISRAGFWLRVLGARVTGNGVHVKTAGGKNVSALISSTSPYDAAEVDSWHTNKGTAVPSYFANQKWRRWWNRLIEARTVWAEWPKVQVLKLSDKTGRILGVMALYPHYQDPFTKQRMTKVEGIRIAPDCNVNLTNQPVYRGVGKALITAAVKKSMTNGDTGIGLNSTLGVEKFYEKLGFRQKPSTDGKRTWFYLEGSERKSY